MVYSLAITLAAALLVLALLGGIMLAARRAAGGHGVGPVAGWRWYPSPLGLLVLLPLAGLLLWRVFPAILLIPIVFPFFRRGRRLAGPARFIWNLGRRTQQPRLSDEEDDETIDGQWRPLDHE